MRRFVVLTFLFILFPTLSYSFDLYVHSVKAPLYQAPSIGSEKVIELKKGSKIVGVEEKENWCKVRYKNKELWVYKLMVKKTPPLEAKGVFTRENLLPQQVRALKEKSRRRPSSFTTTAAARGLRDKRQRFADKYRHDYEAVEKMESTEISDNQALEFLMKGVSNE